MNLTGNPKITWMFLSWLSKSGVCVRVRVCLCVCVRLSDTALTENAAVLNILLSLLSLTAEQRLNSDTAEKALDSKSLLLEGSGPGGWDNLSGTVSHRLSTLLICSHTSDLLTKPEEMTHPTTVLRY